MPTPEERRAHIETIKRFPAELTKLVSGLTDEQLTTPYLDGEWTVAQNVHHVVDSHINSYIRLKLILTEDNPPLKGYKQPAWAQFPDATSPDLEASLTILRGLHARWTQVFENLTDDQWHRVGHHDEVGEMTPDSLTEIYANHCEAHLDQIRRTLAAATTSSP